MRLSRISFPVYLCLSLVAVGLPAPAPAQSGFVLPNGNFFFVGDINSTPRFRVLASGEIFLDGLVGSSIEEELLLCFDGSSGRVGQCKAGIDGDHTVGTNVLVGEGTSSGGARNAILGFEAMGNAAGNANDNVAVGYRALRNTENDFNTAVGREALSTNTTGDVNVAVGSSALLSNTTGRVNVAVGNSALRDNVDGIRNTALGRSALENNVNGSGNIGVGWNAGVNVQLSDNIMIGNTGSGADSGMIRIGTPGTQTSARIAGIYNVVVGGTNHAVYVDSNGQLGQTPSSERFKEDVRDLGERSEVLYRLRPVTFRYKDEYRDESAAELAYGLIAEEVAEVFPEMVIYDQEGRPLSVRYELLSSLLLNELQKQQARLEQLEARDAALAARLERLETGRWPQLAASR